MNFEALCHALLEQAGGALSLTEAAAKLNVSRQALHAQIVSGTALGMMAGDELVVPSFQIEDISGRPGILSGVSEVTTLFTQSAAGPWMALQFLSEVDPNLRCTPIEALRNGRQAEVIYAARAHLHLDEG